MKKSYIILIILWVLINYSASAQSVVISGNISNNEDKKPLAGVSVLIKNSVVGTITDNKGNFSLKTKVSLPVVLNISAIGFEKQEIDIKETTSEVSILMVPETTNIAEVVVSASRVEESILKSPVSIEKLGVRA